MVGMIRHRLETILLIESDGGRFGIHHQPDAANVLGDAYDPVYRIKQHELSDAFSLMIPCRGEPAQPEDRDLFRQAFPIRLGQVSVDQFSQADRLEAQHFGTGCFGNDDKSRGDALLFMLSGDLTKPTIKRRIATIKSLSVMVVAQ